jgi:hypothetical protein
MPPELRETAGNTAAEHLEHIGEVLLAEGDPTGALLAALLVRRLVPRDDPQRTLGFSPTGLYGQTQDTGLRALGLQTTGALLPDFDTMLADLEHRVTYGGPRSQQ